MSISEHEAKTLADFEAYEAEVATLRARVAELERERDGWRAKAIRDPYQLSKLLWSDLYLMVAEANSKHMGELASARADAARLVGRVAELEEGNVRRQVALEAELEGMRQRARVAEAQRDEAVSLAHESLTESVRAKADAARLREALSEANCVLALAVCGELTTKKHVEEAHKKAEAALASAPSAEPTPRDMRVAEAVRTEVKDAYRVAYDGECSRGERLADAIDLAAVVAKAVGT